MSKLKQETITKTGVTDAMIDEKGISLGESITKVDYIIFILFSSLNLSMKI